MAEQHAPRLYEGHSDFAPACSVASFLDRGLLLAVSLTTNRIAIAADYAAISYVDDLIGQTLQTLEELGLAEDTVVSFTGDQ